MRVRSPDSQIFFLNSHNFPFLSKHSYQVSASICGHSTEARRLLYTLPMPRPHAQHPNPLVRARFWHPAATAPDFCRAINLSYDALMDAECGVPHKIPDPYFRIPEIRDDGTVGHQYQAYRILRRGHYFPAPLNCSSAEDFREILSKLNLKPREFARKAAIPTDEIFAGLQGRFSITLRSLFVDFPH
jgi:hypothetical protein